MGLLQMSFSGAVLVLVIAAIRAAVINRLPKKTFLILWGIVLLRLLVPYSLPSAFSIYTLVDSNTPVMIGAENTRNESVQITENSVLIPVGESVYEQADENSLLFKNSITPVLTGRMVWFIGMMLCAGFFIMSYLHWRFAFQTALPVQNHFVAQWLKMHLRRRLICVKQSDQISAPMTYGIIKPVILMPKETNWENTQQLEYVLLHEYIHICHYDSVVKLISTLALCVHWFNPLVWVMYVLLQRDIELACDESVVRRFGEPAKSTYANMLIDMETKKSGFVPLGNSFSKNAVEERIVAIMKMKKTSVIAAIASVVLIIGVGAVFATGASEKKAGEAENNNANFSVFSEEDMDKSPFSNDKITLEIPNDQGSLERMEEIDIEGEQYKTGVISIDVPEFKEEPSSLLANIDALKVREEASENAPVINILQENLEVAVLSEENGFYHILIPCAEGSLEGWVKKEYVDVD